MPEGWTRPEGREEMPNRRRTERRKIRVGGQSIYVEAGFYPDGRIGEVFLVGGKKGSAIRELLDGFGIVLSTALQHGVPLSAYSVADEDSEITGKTNKMLKTIFETVEELCHEEPAAVRPEGEGVPREAAAGDRPAVDPAAGGPASPPHP